jgi:hypothetical protein
MTRDENEVSQGAVYISFTHSGSLEIVLITVAVAGNAWKWKRRGVAVQSQPDSRTDFLEHRFSAAVRNLHATRMLVM